MLGRRVSGYPHRPLLMGRALTKGASRLAYAEITMAFAALFSPRGPKLRLHETDRTDADPACHFLLPVRTPVSAIGPRPCRPARGGVSFAVQTDQVGLQLPRLNSKGIRATVEA